MVELLQNFILLSNTVMFELLVLYLNNNCLIRKFQSLHNSNHSLSVSSNENRANHR